MFKRLHLPALVLLLISCQPGQSVTAAPRFPCFHGASAGYVPPRLKTGQTGHSVATNNLSIHDQPGVNTQITGSLSPSDRFKVLEGPECKDSHVWWRVDNGGLQGWVAESDPATFKYWLKPGDQ